MPKRTSSSSAVAHLILVRPMRNRRLQACLALVICALSALATAANAAAPGSATLAYQDRLNDIVIHLLAPRLASRFDLLRGAGTLKLIYRVRANGDVESVKIISRANQFVTDTCVHTIKSAKLPPIPKSVIKEQGREWVDVHTDISLDR